MVVNSYSKLFFIALNSDLIQRKIKYCIIGDYKNLPDIVDHDIDIWTDDIHGFRTTLFDAIKKTDHRVLIDNQTANGCNVAFYKCEEDTITLMKIDVLIDTSFKSVITLVNKKVIADNVILYKNFYVANPECEAVMHFLYPMFEWGKIKKDVYKTDILKFYKSDIFKKTFIELWGDTTAEDVLMLISEEKWDAIQKMAKTLKKKAMMRSIFKSSTYNNVCVATYKTIRRFFKPSGKVLAFCGLDGAGKTTILEEMNKMFVDLLKRKKVFYGYWRPYVIPEIRELFGKKNSKNGINKQAQMGLTVVEPEKNPKNLVVSFMKLLYFWLDYMLAIFKYGTIHQRGGIVLFDRHYIDMVVYPQRFEMKLPRCVILLMYKFIPKADFTFFLYCTPDEILKRKEEFTKDEIVQMTEDYMTIGKKFKNFVPIHTNTTIVEEIDEILIHVSKGN